MHLIQIINQNRQGRVGIVNEPDVSLLNESISSTYNLFTEIINNDKDANEVINSLISDEILDYKPIYESDSEWKILPPIDTSFNSMMTVLSGTGLTHLASAKNRNKMHESEHVQNLTDSMKIYKWGEEGGKPAEGEIGIQPEWFYKGNGHHLKGHGEPLHVPSFGNDGGEEPEIAGIYLVSQKGIPYRLGFAQANEFSDHVMEKKNYLYLAPSKLRECSIGPEMVLDESFSLIPGKVSVLRNGQTLWSEEIQSGEEAMAHSLTNLEYHHFKYEQHRLPGQLHIHFFGAGAFSFGRGIGLEQGDKMCVAFKNMGRPLINSLHIDSNEPQMLEIRALKTNR